MRNKEIDYLRGLSIFAIILIHSTNLFINNSLAEFLWNINQFSVPAFIFCSSYLFFKKDSKKNFFSYMIKRLKRLLIPYYIFLLAYLVAVLIKSPATITLNYVGSSLLVIGGADLSWLVMLFVQLAAVFYLLSYFYKRKKIIFYTYAIVSLLSSLIFIFYTPQIYNRYYLWLPWSLIGIFSIYFVKFETKKILVFLSPLLSFILFIILFFVVKYLGHNTNFINNKYPPNFYYLSYGIFSVIFLISIFKLNILPNFLKKGLNFLSFNSYQIFFLHYLILYLLTGLTKSIKFEWFGFFILLFALTIIGQIFINYILSRIKIYV